MEKNRLEAFSDGVLACLTFHQPVYLIDQEN